MTGSAHTVSAASCKIILAPFPSPGFSPCAVLPSPPFSSSAVSPPAKTREQIALAVAQANECDYCLAAHTTLGKMAGLSADQIRDSRRATSVEPKADALIRFARTVVDTKGRVSNADLQTVREAGFDDGAIAEVVAHVALNVFTNYFNQVADTDIDFPKAEPLVDHHDACVTIPGCDPTR